MIVWKDLKKHYSDFTLDVSARLPSGKLIALLGPSGCGKSTALRIMAGFESGHEGEIEINGKTVHTIPAENRNFGMVFQDYALFPHMTVKQNICYGLKMKQWPQRDQNRRTEELLEIVSLQGYESRMPQSLSGGEMQRVALARALAPSPGVLLLDEPLSALDAALRKELRLLIKKIQKDENLSVIFVTHDQEEALAIADYLVIMKDGRISQQGEPEEVYQNPKTHFSARFLGNHREISITGDNSGNFLSSFSTLTEEIRDKLKSEDSLHLFIRPEHCRVMESGQGDAESETAGILYREYCGDRFFLILDIKGYKIPAYSPVFHDLRNVDTCRVHLNWDKIIALPPE